jgi:hypothetical protein
MKMPVVMLTLIIAAFAGGAVLGILALLIIGIRRGDRAHMHGAPVSHPDAIARRILAGARHRLDSEEDDQ